MDERKSGWPRLSVSLTDLTCLLVHSPPLPLVILHSSIRICVSICRLRERKASLTANTTTATTTTATATRARKIPHSLLHSFSPAFSSSHPRLRCRPASPERVENEEVEEEEG